MYPLASATENDGKSDNVEQYAKPGYYGHDSDCKSVNQFSSKYKDSSRRCVDGWIVLTIPLRSIHQGRDPHTLQRRRR